MAGQEVLVLRTGVANLASVLAGFRRLGASPRLTEDPAEVAAATHVMVPGVGAFGAAMDRLRETGLDRAILDRVAADKPTVAICVGLQVFCEESEETPGARGLGILPVKVRRFPETVVVPQLGWNHIDADKGCRYLRSGYTYFANSYFVESVPDGWSAARAEHGVSFVAGLERGNTLVCQFHPELSGGHGLDILGAWLDATTAGG
ncbi:MAG: imidazole glycerol phosphate synthase subunit HisH [Candidatus Sumerlaeia bacterium]|nr:imidazole glycerol phosphate synthase subunit HisH [Candidatus Sumerlaeia bacterium]